MGLFGKKEDPEDLMYQAMAFLEKNQPKAAVTLFKKVTKIEPENVNAWYNQGSVSYTHLTLPTKA